MIEREAISEHNIIPRDEVFTEIEHNACWVVSFNKCDVDPDSF